MDIRLEINRILLLSMLCLLVKRTYTHNVSAEEPRHPRVTGRIVKLYSGVKPDPILCSGEGFQADPVNCAVFYRCVKGSSNRYTVFRYQCGPGTVYDPDTEICNHPMNTKRADCGGRNFPLSSSINDNEIDGSRQEVPTPISTKPPTYSEQTTAYKVDTTLSTRNVWSTSSDKKASQSFTLSTAYPWVSNRRQSQVTEAPVFQKLRLQDGEQCTTDGFMGDSENCRKFYRCVGNGRGGYIRYEFSCSDLTIWDDDAQVCNHAWAVKRRRCGRYNPDDNKNTTAMEENEVFSDKTIQSQLQINYGSKVNQIQTQISKGSVIQNQTQINYGNSSNQNNASKAKQNQTQISHGSAVSQTQTQINHGNDAIQTQLQIDHTKESSQSQTQINEANSEQTSVSPENDGIQEPSTQKPVNGNGDDQCTQSGFMGDSKNCKKFYRCVDNGRGSYIKYEFSCGEGTVWDPNAEACNHEWAVKDCKNKAPTGTASQDVKTSTTTKAPTQHTTSEDDDVGYGGQNQDNTSTTTAQQDKPITTTESTTKTTQVSTTTSSNTATSAGNVCTSSGFMGDSEDCQKFYRCVDNGKGGFTKYEYRCGEGTLWDTEIDACNHAWAVRTCGSSSNAGSTEKVTTSSSEMQTSVASTGSSNEDYDTGYGQPQNEPTTSTTTSSITSRKPQVNTDQRKDCTTSGFMGDENDCRKFYRCVDDGKEGYTRYEFTCGEGTVWDQSISACNHPSSDNECKKTESSTHTTQEESVTQTSTPSTTTTITDKCENGEDCTSTTINKPTDKPISNAGYCSAEGFFGDTKDCRKFYRCVDNQQGGFTKYDFTCGEGTIWDPEINSCNHVKSVKDGCSYTPNNMDTTQKQPVNENDEYPESSTSGTNTATATTQSVTQQPSSSSNKCESEGFFANPDDCKKFYRCADDGKGGYTKYDFSCGDGTVWDAQAQTCNHETSQSKCSQSSTSSSSEKPQTDSETTTHKETVNESTTSKQPPEDSHTSSSKDQCSSEGFYANSDDCRKFYRCVDNGKGGYTKYDFSCGEGTVWVQEIQACDHDNDISNCSSQTVSSTTSYQEEHHGSTESSSSDQSSTTEKQNNEISSGQSGGSTSSNECKSEGFYPNKNDCKKFYRCVDNGKGGYTSYDFTCGEGTAWDTEIESCNHINEVKSCQGSQNQNQSGSGTVDETPSQTTESTSTSKTSTTESSGENKPPTSTDKCEKEGYFGDSNNCKKFYRCVDNGKGGLTKYDYTCGEGTIWDQDLTTCNHPGDVQNPSCNNNNVAATTEGPSDGSSSTSGSSTPSSESSSSSSSESQGSSDCSQNSTQKPPNKNVNCTKAGFYADPDDCKKFYRCVDWDNNGKRFSVYHFDCGEGTIWDPELETCNHEDSVYPPRDCSGSQSQEQNTSESSTTTEKPTTGESTTQESTTTESTTETSTTESTTTQLTTTESTTTTTEQSSTTEQSTTQKSTTTKKSTTQQSSTTEQTTTQQSSTTEESTTAEQASTTEQSTTQESTTQESTTQESTTQESTTQESTTQESTTQESTTQESTTQATTTEESTTQQSTTEQSTTEQSTTEQNTSEQSTTEQSTTEQTTESSTEQSSTTEETTTQAPSTTDSTESSTTEQSSSTTEANQESTTESSSGSKECPETDDDQYVYVCPTSFRRHPKYCNMFYQCTEEDDSHDLHIAVFKCPNNTIYDESQTKCVDKDKADKKCEGEIEERKRVKRLNTNFKDPIVVGKQSMGCTGTGHYPFEKSECSPAFLKCDKTKSGRLRGYVHRCPEGYVYWSISRRCETKASVRDCKLTANDWRGRWEIPIERKNVAS